MKTKLMRSMAKLLREHDYKLAGDTILRIDQYGYWESFGRKAVNEVDAVEQLIPIIREDIFFNAYTRLMSR